MKNQRILLWLALALSVSIFSGIAATNTGQAAEDIANTPGNASKSTTSLPRPVTVHFNDAQLEAAIRNALNKSSGDITDVDMASLTLLYAWSKGITDISGLEYAVNLQTLYLFDNQISDLTSLANLKVLKLVDIRNNNLNLSPGSDAMRIINTLESTGARVSYNRQNMKNNESALHIIIRDQLGIPDGEELTGQNMAGLTRLTLSGGNIQDLSGLELAVNLQKLDLSANKITDISPLYGLTNLNDLDLQLNQISDISPLENLTGLRSLNLGHNQVSDISSLANMTHMQSIFIWENNISDISVLVNMPELEHISAGENQLSDISSLANHKSLKTIYLGNNRIKDISSLAGLSVLNYLRLNQNQIGDIMPLANLTELETLEIYGNQVSDISPLSKLTKIKRLIL
ncbi:MAG: leucine-rich repeat domain-containing protein [Syntrophomonadaceae bacterium]